MAKVRVLVAILLALAVTSGAEAQGIGSGIKQKVTQAASGKAPAANPQAAAQSGSKLGFELTEPVMQAFEKGVQAEIAGRQAYLKSIAGLKTQDEFHLCEGETMATPDGMAIQEEYAARMDKAATQADMEKALAWMESAMTALVTKSCGANPGPLYDAQRDEFRKAQQAGAAELETVLPNAANTAGYNYALLTEWAAAFYALSRQAQQNAAANGVAVNGQDADHQYVYTAAEATLLVAHRATLEPLLKEVT